jgi:hypothetical protein
VLRDAVAALAREAPGRRIRIRVSENSEARVAISSAEDRVARERVESASAA